MVRVLDCATARKQSHVKLCINCVCFELHTPVQFVHLIPRLPIFLFMVTTHLGSGSVKCELSNHVSIQIFLWIQVGADTPQCIPKTGSNIGEFQDISKLHFLPTTYLHTYCQLNINQVNKQGL